MALNKTGLEEALTSFFDPDKGLPESNGNVEDHQKACAKLWADAMQIYVQAMEPLHVTAGNSIASGKLQTALEGVFAAWFALDTYPSDNCGLLNAAFDAFAADIAASVGNETSEDRTDGIARVFAGTPPPGIDFCPFSTGATYAIAAANFATRIDNWFTQGESVTTDNNVSEGKDPLTLAWR